MKPKEEKTRDLTKSGYKYPRRLKGRRPMRIHLDRRICVEDVGFPHSQPNWNMVGGFAHDFRNFIHIIGGTADLMKRRTQDTQMLKHCEVIMDVCRMATDLVDDMVSLSRDNEDGFSEININDEVRRWTALMIRTLPGGHQTEKGTVRFAPFRFRESFRKWPK